MAQLPLKLPPDQMQTKWKAILDPVIAWVSQQISTNTAEPAIGFQTALVKTGDYSVDLQDLGRTLAFDCTSGSVTCTLPNPSLFLGPIIIVKTDSTANTVTISDGGFTALNIALDTQQETVTLVSTSTGWTICDHVEPYPLTISEAWGSITPNAQNIYVNNGGTTGSINLSTAGDWIVYAEFFFGAAAAVTYGQWRCGWFGANGTGSGSAPAAVGAVCTVLGGDLGDRILAAPNGDNGSFTMTPIKVRTTQATRIYQVGISSMTTPGNARWSGSAWAQRVSKGW